MSSLLVILIVLVCLLLVGAPVMFAVGFAGFIYFIIAPDMWSSVGIYAHKFFTGMDSFVFLCIPLFMLAGDLMSQSGMMNDIVRFAQLLVGRFRGGLAYVNVVNSMIFGGISGSAMADISGIGRIEIEMMKKAGYTPEFSAALTAVSAVQGPIIPPSIPMVIFASVTNVSVGALFFGGALPGVLIGASQMVVIAMMAKRRAFPKSDERYTFKEAIQIFLSAFWSLLMPIIVLGGILLGAFTATEAAAMAAGYALIISYLVYKKMSLASFYQCLMNSLKTTASIYLIVAFSVVLGWIFAVEGVPQLLGDWVKDWNLSPNMVLLMINIFLLINGCFMSDSVTLILFAPILTPLVTQLGIHPIHFGVVMVVNVMLGLITPPYGFAFYLAASISNTKLRSLVIEAVPFIIAAIAVLFLITYVPQFVLFVPTMLGLVK
ncbi:MAG: TRAP transporter large permease [Deltaproteobacteria bacterium]|nr:TRAP transporter large permease [Deltaproteobacteria bacterium]